MYQLRLLLCALVLLGFQKVTGQQCDSASTTVEVDVPPMGRVRGYKYKGNTTDPCGDVAVFKGIPYAQQPTGDNRWRPPQPLKNGWRDIVDGYKFGPGCRNVDAGGLRPAKDTDEECLYLNIWVPMDQLNSLEQRKPLPVKIFIHGGGFIIGSASDEIVSPNPLELTRKMNVVFINFNYRLGPLGFMAHPAMATGMPSVSSLFDLRRPWLDSDFSSSTFDHKDYFDGFDNNTIGGIFGLQDQLLAMKFVQKFIRYFGGDRNRVTAAGNSAGAFSLCLHLVNPEAQGLFQKVIMQSTMCDFKFVPRGEAMTTSKRMAEQLGCSRRAGLQKMSQQYGIQNWSLEEDGLAGLETTLSSHKSLSAFKAEVHLTLLNELKCMKNKTVYEVNTAIKARRAILWWDGVMWFPVINGFDIPAHPRHLIARGHVLPNVTIVTGTVRDEATLFFALGFPVYLSSPDLAVVLKALQGEQQNKRVWEWYDHHGIYPKLIEFGPLPDDPPPESCSFGRSLLDSRNTSRRETEVPGPKDLSPATVGAKLLSDLWHCATWRNDRELVWARALQTKAALGYIPQDWSSGIYVYSHAVLPSWLQWPMNHLGVYHGSDMKFLFHRTSQMNENETKLAGEVTELFRRFIWDKDLTIPASGERWVPISLPTCVREALKEIEVPSSSDNRFAFYMPYKFNFNWPIDLVKFDSPHPTPDRLLPLACTELWDDPNLQYTLESSDSATITADNTSVLSQYELPLEDKVSLVGVVRVPPSLKEPFLSHLLNVRLIRWVKAIQNGGVNLALTVSALVLGLFVTIRKYRNNASSKEKTE